MNVLCKLLLAMVLLSFPVGAKADHENVPFLEDALPIRAGMCSITADTGTFAVPCEQYIKPDGELYLALYLEGKIAVVRKIEADGSVGAVVWSVSPVPVKPVKDREA